MSKYWFKKLHHSVLKRKTPLLGLTVLQVCVLFLLINGGAAAVILSQHQRPEAPGTDTTLSAPETDISTAQPLHTAPQGNAPETPSTQNVPSNTPSTQIVNDNLPDQYGCIPQTQGYDDCVKYAKKNALTLWCGEQSKAAGDTYYPATTKAEAAYDEVMAEWDAVKNLPYYAHNPYDEYAADAKTKYNAIIKPAYATYVNTINRLNAQGCNEILTYTDSSWADY